MQEFVVTEPPTAKEVRERIAAAWVSRQLFRLTVEPTYQEIPHPHPIEITVDMRGTQDPKLGESKDTLVLGTLVQPDHTSEIPTVVRIMIDNNLTQPATVSF